MPPAETRKPVAIIGGGITGLAAAYRLQQASAPYVLFEASERLGGKILTEHVEGFVIEGGPDSVLAQKPWAVELARDLGLEAELIGTDPAQKQLYVVDRGRLVPMPDGVMLIIPTRFMPFVTSPLITWPGKLRMGMDLVLPARRDDADESIGSFIRRRLGNEALEKIAAPLLSGIHVSDPERQSLLGTFPRFRTVEKQHGSLIRGMLAQRRVARASGNGHHPPQNGTYKSSVFISMKNGLTSLVEGLTAALSGKIRTRCPVAAVWANPDGSFTLRLADGSLFQAGAVVLAAPAYASAELLSGFLPDLAQELSAIRYVSTATVSLGFARDEIGGLLRGSGFLIPRKENRQISACTLTSNKFAHRAPEGQVLLRCFLGGPGREEIVSRGDEEIISTVRAELEDLLGLRAEPSLARVYRWQHGNPQYDVGHLERIRELNERCAQVPGLLLAGGAYEGVGVPDCIHQGQQAADRALQHLQDH
ncbi:MAG TPA: protoporphyrinogen oxidase [Anaerolineaceae bacterium]